MVKSVEVKNFKSISDLKIDLGRINVFIGENGSGKSNILEAIAFGAAASAQKLDKEFLTSRGMRVPEPKLMRSAFSKNNLENDILISFVIDKEEGDKGPSDINYKLRNSNDEFAKWEEQYVNESTAFFAQIQDYLFNGNASEPVLSLIKAEDKRDAEKGLRSIKAIIDTVKSENPEPFSNSIFTKILMDEFIRKNIHSHNLLDKYKIYAPENTFLRRFQDEEAGDPLGIRGEGLFRLIRYFKTHETQHCINTIRESLGVLDWFEDFTISNDLAPGESKLSIKDRYLDSDIALSQNSANEGFLFILFYISLFVSEDAPSFFAIDNLDASFNPKLCKKITQTLVNLAKDEKINKQALFTTHNPFILDGLDLTDDDQRLFVVYRSLEGHTIVDRIKPNKRKMKLSEQWMHGYLGGLPENF